MLTNRLLARPRTATTGVIGARRRAREAGRNMVNMAGDRGEEVRKREERERRESMEERDRHRPGVELGEEDELGG